MCVCVCVCVCVFKEKKTKQEVSNYQELGKYEPKLRPPNQNEKVLKLQEDILQREHGLNRRTALLQRRPIRNLDRT